MASLPSTGDSTPQISSHLGGATSGDLGTVDIFATNRLEATSPPFCGVLGRFPQGAGNTPQPSTREAVKRKITNNMSLSPQTARLDPISDARAENRTRHAAEEQIKAVSKIRRPAGGALSLPPQARVEQVAQTVTEEVDPEHRE